MAGALTRREFLARTGALGAGLLVARAPGLANGATRAMRTGPAATVIVNGRVVTRARGPIVQALAIGQDGRILEVGTDAAIRRLVGGATEVVDAAGGTGIAGIHDGHAHPMNAGLGMLNPSLYDATLTIPELQAILTGFLEGSAESEPDGWLEVQSWNPVGLLPPGTVAHRRYLDVLPTTRPIALHGSDVHNMWVNSRALELAGIDASTPDPTGGEIVRDEDGPTGVLVDAAQGLVSSVIPEPSRDVQLAAMSEAFALMAAGGVTSCLDAWVDPWQLDAYAALASAGAIRQRVVPALLVPEELIASPDEALRWASDLARDYGAVPGLRFGTAKVFMDGVMEFPAQTAALLDPYLDGDGNPTEHYGDLSVDAGTMARLAMVLDAAGWQVHAHAIGDAAVRAALDAYRTAWRRNGPRGNRHTIAHLQLVHPDDYPHFARLDVIPDMQLHWATRNVWTLEALGPYIGTERHRRLYPAGSLLRAGARLAGGSDWPVTPLIPWNQVQTAIDRHGLYGDGQSLHRGQGIGRMDSLRMHTLGAAYQMHLEHRTGTLRAGKDADLVVLDRDVTTIRVSEIKDAQVRLTLLKGEVTFDASSSAGRKLVRRMERARAAAAAPFAGVPHDGLSGRHAGCPCVARR